MLDYLEEGGPLDETLAEHSKTRGARRLNLLAAERTDSRDYEEAGAVPSGNVYAPESLAEAVLCYMDNPPFRADGSYRGLTDKVRAATRRIIADAPLGEPLLLDQGR